VYAAPHRLLCSYSGNTAETVHAFEQSRREQIWFSMSSGGRLSELATKRGTPHVTLPGGYPPRAAVGFSLGVLKAIFEAVYGVAPHSEWSQAQNELIEDSETYRTLDAETNPALKLAVSLVDRTPVIYTLDGQTMPAVAARFHAQLAENSKVWSHSAELPEMAHNEVESFEFLAQVLPPPKVIFLGSWHLGSTFPDPRPGLRSLLDSMGIAHATLDPRELWPSSEGRLASGLRMMLLLDAASIYLALARAIDPFEIPAITRLKKTTLGA
jgi:glucose/mannose-6-phosphate isomerase